MARGHRISIPPEIPLVADFGEVSKTKEAMKMLKIFGARESWKEHRRQWFVWEKESITEGGRLS